jgi:hypothetical protein
MNAYGVILIDFYIHRNMKVFFTGLEHLKMLTSEIIERIDKVCFLDAEVLIGNYKGFDQLALSYLAQKAYPYVTIYETGSGIHCGYKLLNVGKYPAQNILMSKKADYAFAIHTGTKGVLRNIERNKGRVRVINI